MYNNIMDKEKKTLEYRKEYYIKNREEILKKKRLYYINNKEKLQVKYRELYQQKKNKILGKDEDGDVMEDALNNAFN